MEALSTSTNRCECSHFEVKYRSTTKYVFPAAFGPWCTTSFLFDLSSMFALWIIAGVKTLVWDLLTELPGLLIHTLWQVLALAEAPTTQNLWLTEEVSASFATHSGGSYRNVSIRDGWVESWGRMGWILREGPLRLFGGSKVWRSAWFGANFCRIVGEDASNIRKRSSNMFNLCFFKDLMGLRGSNWTSSSHFLPKWSWDYGLGKGLGVNRVEWMAFWHFLVE